MKSLTSSLASLADDIGKLVLRVFLAVAIFPHGAQKVLGTFGGDGLSATWTSFTETMKITPVVAALTIFAEFLAPIFLAFGLFTRIAAALLAVVMALAASARMDNGFFLNWDGVQNGEGMEFHLLLAGTALAIVLIGGGNCSLDRFLRGYRKGSSDSDSDGE